ncbi:hypothetical protein K432DRAFT_203153 [Lepidopterella palustris CBS 459.81]|uniref:Uncharacterized protein n=1 Tax=Lepidopterella palustris CBS 459.81 TaxID=1314670 RepID=A0A8E2EG55_9PEZI|nr:hypothetical protein K432DRAFT_203153 [Lepidopterella palustris CBS 459.81]
MHCLFLLVLSVRPATKSSNRFIHGRLRMRLLLWLIYDACLSFRSSSFRVFHGFLQASMELYQCFLTLAQMMIEHRS